MHLRHAAITASTETRTATSAPRVTARQAARIDRTAVAWTLPDSSHHRHVAGIVYLDDKPISTTLTLVSNATRNGVIDAPAVTSAADGTFDFGEVTVEYFTVVARAGKVTRELELDLNTYTDPEHLAVHIYPCSESVGHVVDAGGGPIVGAVISGSISGALLAASDAKGEFQLCGAGGSLTVQADGYAIERTGMLASNPIIVVMRPETSLTGIVVDASDRPIVGAEILESSSNVVFGDGNGRFEMRGLAPGPHNLKARRDDLVACEKTHVDTVVGQSVDIKIVLAHGVTVSGYAHRGNKPASNIEIVWIWSNPTAATLRMRTHEDGTFSNAGACPGDGHLIVPDGDVSVPKDGAYTLSPTSSPVDIELAKTIALPVRVVSGDQAPLGGPVELDHHSGSIAPFTNSAGTTTLMLPPDSSCSIIGAQMFDGRRAESAPLSTNNLPAEFVIDLGAPSSTTITATVTNKSGAAVANIGVALINQAGTTIGGGLSDINGVAIIRHVPPGTFHFATSKTSFTDPAVPSVITPSSVTISSESTNVSITIVADVAQTTVSGIVVDDHGAPVADAHVIAYPMSDDRVAAALNEKVGDMMGQLGGTVASTDESGHFSMTMSVAPPYTLNASASQGRGALRIHDVTADLHVVLTPTPH